MQVNQMNSFYLVDKIEQHIEIKDKLLELFDLHPASDQKNNIVHVNKLDWQSSTDSNRPWSKLFSPILKRKLHHMMYDVGYTGVTLENLWFQQYVKHDVHNWHCHGSTWVGVYYLELDQDSPITEIRDPLTKQNIITPNVVEGDIIVFPSYVIHRAPEVTSDSRKTIISFNFTCGNIE